MKNTLAALLTLLTAAPLTGQATGREPSRLAARPPAAATHVTGARFNTVDDRDYFLEFVGGGAAVGAFVGLVVCPPNFKPPPKDGPVRKEKESANPSICSGTYNAMVAGALIGAFAGYFARLGVAAWHSRYGMEVDRPPPVDLVTFRIPIG